jgi:O-6-methylguanine DNA methyltransferase
VGLVVADWTGNGLARLQWYLGQPCDAEGSGCRPETTEGVVFCSHSASVPVGADSGRAAGSQLRWQHRSGRHEAVAARRVWQRWREPLEAWGDRFWRAELPVVFAPLWEPDGLLDLSELSPFGLRVLRQLSQLRFGERISYGGLARLAGVPGGARGVAQALARNRWPVLLPCHRVVAADGSLGGYSGGGGAAAKRWLLEHESRGGTQIGLFG